MRWQIYAPSRALVLQALCIFWGIFFGVQICFCKNTWSSSIYHKTDNTRLTDSYVSLYKVTAIACCSRCHSDTSCKSVTYNPGSQECRLSRVSFTNVSNSETSDEWATYSEYHPCPEPWILYHKHCYRVVSSKQTWEESVQNCKNMSAYLTDVLDCYKNTFVTQISSYADIKTTSIWLGLGNYHTKKPQPWTSGQQVDYTNFARGQPNNQREYQVCIELRICNNGTWYDTRCHHKQQSVCKKRHY